MKKVLIRSMSGAVYIGLIVTAIYIGQWTNNTHVSFIVPTVLFGVMAAIGLFEYFRCIEKSGSNVNKPLGYIVGCLTYLAIVFTFTSYFSSSTVTSTAVTTLLMVLLLSTPVGLFWQLFKHDRLPFATLALTLAGVLYVVLPFSLMKSFAFITEYSGLLMMTFILVWVNDTGAYLSGMALGRHKLWQRHSPGKTWEGCIGGLVLCIAAAVIVGPLFNIPYTWLQWAATGLMVSVVGTLGDLAESMLKRSAGMKDSGSIMPGHGGILDRFDSMLAIVPFQLIMSLLFLV